MRRFGKFDFEPDDQDNEVYDDRWDPINQKIRDTEEDGGTDKPNNPDTLEPSETDLPESKISGRLEKFFVSFAIRRKYQSNVIQLPLELERGKTPSVANFRSILQKEFGLDFDLKSFELENNNISFRPIDWEKTDVLEARVMRVEADRGFNRPIPSSRYRNY